jgi:two-component system LytT family response regulator
MKIRTLIVDDEALGRERIRKLLGSYPDIEIVGECSNGREAVEAIHDERPNLVFLDVQMPELDGFGVIESLDQESLPGIIFVTAHDKFALKAFDVHAIDYLLKPFDRDRFEQALTRALEKLRPRESAPLDQRVLNMLNEMRPQPKVADRLVVKVDGRVLLIKTSDVDWIEAADNYVSLHIGSESHLLRETMSSLEKRLPPDQFLRISRSTIVNVERIKELQPMFHGEYVVILRTGAKLNLSRGYREKLNQLLGKEA